MHRLHCMKDKLICYAHEELEKPMECINTCELGEVIDMIKDLAEAIYHCKVVEAMEDRNEQPQAIAYTGTAKIENASFDVEGEVHKTEMMHKAKEAFMESKASHNDKADQMTKLNAMMEEVSSAIMDVTKDSTPEEKQMIHQSLTNLAGKIKA